MHWFPSINAKYNVNDWMSLRGAYYRSATRPDYALLSPSMVADNNKNNLISYNPYLKPALANNYDLAISFYSNKLGLFTANAFYKEMSGLIYRLPEYQPKYFENLEGAPASLIESLKAPRQLYSADLFDKDKTYQMNNNNMPINNPNLSTVKGIELSWQTNFWYLPGLLSGLVLDLNYSMIWSATQLPYIDFQQGIDSTGRFPKTVYIPTYKTRDSKLLDQADMLWNARIGWDYKGFSSRLSFRYQGETITKIDPEYSLGDEILEEVFRIDLSLKQQITERLSCTIDIANLNQFVDIRNQHAAGYVLPKSMEYYGSVIQIGLKYEI
ncbi:MAG: TonB-dependent receptor [Prolixibacteraceae bacterium]|nr:TonB-dependent receptor [Prolixibacteraceae bacterium]